MEIALIIAISILTVFIAALNYTYKPEVGEGIMLRFAAAVGIFILTMILAGNFPVGPVETVNSIKEKVGICRHKAPDAQYCVIKIKLVPDAPTSK